MNKASASLVKEEAATRQFGLAAGIGLAGVATGSMGQQRAAPLPMRVSEFGSRHRSVVQIGEILKGAPLVSEAGLQALLKALVELGLIEPEEASELSKLIHLIFTSDALSTIEKETRGIANDLMRRGKDVAVAIAGIAADRVQAMTKRFGDKDTLKAVAIIGADVGGGLGGAILCAGGGVLGAALGALAGAVSGSALAAYKAA